MNYDQGLINMAFRSEFLHVGLLVLMSTLIGAMFPMLKIAEQSIPPLTLTMLRVLLASGLMLITVGVLMQRSLAPLATYWKTFAFLGLLLSVFFVAISEAEERITASQAALMGCTVPSATFLITTVVLRWEPFSWLRCGGMLVALAGMVLFIGTQGLSSGGGEFAGIAIIFCGYIVYAVNMIYARFCNLDPFLTATGTLLYAALFMSVIAFTQEHPLAIRPTSSAWLASACIGLFSTGLVYLLLYYLIANVGPVFAATSGYIFPIVTLVLSHIMIGESMDVSHLVGLAVTLVGAWLVNKKPDPVQGGT